MKTLTDRSWKGYTLAELQAQRQLNDEYIDAQKERIVHEYNVIKAGRENQSGTFRKMLGALSYIDYAVLGVSAVKRITSLVKLFRRK